MKLIIKWPVTEILFCPIQKIHVSKLPTWGTLYDTTKVRKLLDNFKNENQLKFYGSWLVRPAISFKESHIFPTTKQVFHLITVIFPVLQDQEFVCLMVFVKFSKPN